MQPDTIIPDQFNPQSWNRFSYVRNNPILLIDPTGHNELCGVLIPEEDCQDDPPQDTSGGGGGGGGGGSGGCSEDDDLCWLNQGDNDEGDSGGGRQLALELPILSYDDNSCGDAEVGCEIRYDVGVVIIHYNGQYKVIDLNAIKNDPNAMLALNQFIENSNGRVDSQNDLHSAQTNFFVASGEALETISKPFDSI